MRFPIHTVAPPAAASCLALLLACSNQEPGENPDPDPPSLRTMKLGQWWFNHGAYYIDKAMTPKFHPDTLAYLARLDDSVDYRLCMEPAADFSLTVTFNDTLVQPNPLWDETCFSFSFVGSSRFKATVENPTTGQSRTYVVSNKPRIPEPSKDWRQLPRMPGFASSVEFVDKSTGFAKIRWASLFKTTDGGLNWTAVTQPPGHETDQSGLFAFANADNGYMVFSDAFFYRTMDGGNQWTRLPAPPVIELMRFPTPRVGYATSDQSVFQTLDGGESWSETTVSFHPLGIRVLPPSVVFIYGSKGNVLRSMDAGGAWEDVSVNLDSTRDITSFFAVGTDTLFASNRIVLFRSIDGGRSWHTMEISSEYRILDMAFTDPITGFLLVSDGVGAREILKTEDGGASWIPQYSSYYDFVRFDFPAAGTGYAIGGNGNTFGGSDFLLKYSP